MSDHSHCAPPPATASELAMLDQIDRLTGIAADDPAAAPDVLAESLAVERHLEKSRTQTWLTWFETIAKAVRQ